MPIRRVALLRGINVGGANRVAMADLRATFTALGCTNVVTHIQSGNVLFDTVDGAGGLDAAALAEAITATIATRHGLAVPVVLRTLDELSAVVERHPDAGRAIDSRLLHVVFLDREPAEGAVSAIDPARYEPDRFDLDGREVFVTYPAGSGRSKLTIDVFERALGVTATARNLNTVTKLVALGRGG